MLEERVAEILQRYLGDYVQGLSKDALKISVWRGKPCLSNLMMIISGDLELQNMQLKPEALNALKLPLKVKAGFLGSIKLKVPWNRLGREPVIVILDQIFILAQPLVSAEYGQDVSDESLFEAKQRHIKEAEASLVESQKDKKNEAEQAKDTSWLGQLIGTVIGNLKLSITNIHIRYEDDVSFPGHPLAAGLTLERLAAATIDEEGNETFVAHGAMECVRKALALQRLAIYFDSDTSLFEVDKPWQQLGKEAWSEIFEPGIKKDPDDLFQIEVQEVAKQKLDRHYILEPINGAAEYFRRGKAEQRRPDSPLQTIDVKLEDVTLSMSESQYRDTLVLADNLSAFNKRMKHAHIRPANSIHTSPHLWWKYALRASLERRGKYRGSLAWKHLLEAARMRRRYLELYVSLLQARPGKVSINDNEEIQAMDKVLDTDVIIMWRMLAHNFVTTGQGENERPESRKSWWLFKRRRSSRVDSEAQSLTSADWARLNDAIGYEPGMGNPLVPGQEPSHMLHTHLTITMLRNSSRLDHQDGALIAELTSHNLQVDVDVFPKTLAYTVTLGSYGIATPEGMLAQSEKLLELGSSVRATFTYKPHDSDYLWILEGKAAPVHATLWTSSLNRVQEFFQSKKAVSRALALSTTAALQSTLDEVARSAQKKLSRTLKDRPKFSIDLDIAAPKVAIPTSFKADGKHETALLLDFGNFLLQTDNDAPSRTTSDEELRLYMSFKLSASDISATLVDGHYDWSLLPQENQERDRDGLSSSSAANSTRFLPLLDKCGTNIALQQICIPHQQYPTTRAAVLLPKLGFHFSPGRYHRLMAVVKALEGDMAAVRGENVVTPWKLADFEGELDVLTCGGRAATWQHRYGALAGPFLYLLDSPEASTYKHRTRLQGKQVVDVPPDAVGGESHVLAICDSNRASFKVSESLNGVLLRFCDNASKLSWKERMTSAIYLTSLPAAVAAADRDDDTKDALQKATDGSEQLEPAALDKFFLTGILEELTITVGRAMDASSKTWLVDEEIDLLQLHAFGGKVELLYREFDLSVGATLQSVDIEDRLCSHLGPACRFIARSYLVSPVLTANEYRRLTHAELESPASRQNSAGSNLLLRRSTSFGIPSRAESGGSYFDAFAEFQEVEEVEEVAESINDDAENPLQPNTSYHLPDQIPSTSEALHSALDEIDDQVEENGTKLGLSRQRSKDRHGLGRGPRLPGRRMEHPLQRLPSVYHEVPEQIVKQDPRSEPPPFVRQLGLLLDKHASRDEEGIDSCKNFIKIQYVRYYQESPDYDNVDKKLRLRLATLSFFINRPTVIALMDLISDVTREPDVPGQAFTDDIPRDSDHVVSMLKSKSGNDDEDEEADTSSRGTLEPEEETGSKGHGIAGQAAAKLEVAREQVVQGLVGKGKNQVTLDLLLDMDRTQFILNKEDGLQMALLAQERILTEVKVYPATFWLQANIGNLRICDLTLGEGHPNAWLCDTRDTGSKSFVELEVAAYDKESDSYAGYDYSVDARLAQVRIVLLYRFIQELIGYFNGLAPEDPGQLVALREGVSEVERFFTQSEIEGMKAIKLDLRFEKPVLIVPRDSNSPDYLEFYMQRTHVSNSFQWLHGGKDEPSAVHMERTSVKDIHLAVGVEGKSGPGIIQQIGGIDIKFCRPLRDLWHTYAAFEVLVKLDKLHAAMSDKECEVIAECATSNFSEPAHLPPPVNRQPQQPVQPDSCKEAESEAPCTREEGPPDLAEKPVTVVFKVRADLVNAQLGLYTGDNRNSKLAFMQLQGFWLGYHSNSKQEQHIMATVPRFFIKDGRPGIPMELRYIIGNADEVESITNTDTKSAAGANSNSSQNTPSQKLIVTKALSGPTLTMLVVDVKLGPNLTSISLRMQRPRLLVAVDFLVAIGEFFVPSLGAAMVGSAAGKDDDDPLGFKRANFLTQERTVQRRRTILSPSQPLVVDHAGLENYEYDGGGGVLVLQGEDGHDLRAASPVPLIIIGNNKQLKFKNLHIQNGEYLDSAVRLGCGSSYSALAEDNVQLSGPSKSSSFADQLRSRRPDVKAVKDSAHKEEATAPNNLSLDIQALGSEFTFYDSTKWPVEVLLHPEVMLRARVSIFGRCAMRGNDLEVNARVKSLDIISSTGLNVLEPFNTVLSYSRVAGRQNVTVSATDIVTNLSFSVLRLMYRLSADYMHLLHITSEDFTVPCGQFDKIWSDSVGHTGQRLAFWRPRAPPGFASLGDCVTSHDLPPTQTVLAVNLGQNLARKPVSFELVWSTREEPAGQTSLHKSGQHANQCYVWKPHPPHGYIALGYVATTEDGPPPLSSLYCVVESLITPSTYLRDCIYLPNPSNRSLDAAFWRIDNGANSFIVRDTDSLHNLQAFNIRRPMAEKTAVTMAYNSLSSDSASNFGSAESLSLLDNPSSANLASLRYRSGRFYENVGTFSRIWWNKGISSQQSISIWRPSPPQGYAILGDVSVTGYEPPSLVVVVQDTDDGRLALPEKFLEKGHFAKGKIMEDVTFWYPVAPSGFKALGYICSRGRKPPDLETVRCVRDDLVLQVKFAPKSQWSNEGSRGSARCSIWQADNKANTFYFQQGFDAPQKWLAYGLVDLNKPKLADSIILELHLTGMSTTFYDDFGGLMAPLVDATMSNTVISVHGRPEILSVNGKITFAASSFNGRTDAWEPLMEPLTGFSRYEYNNDRSEAALPAGSTVRLSTTSDVNVNLSSANTNLLLEAYASWTRLAKIEEEAKRQFHLKILEEQEETETDENGPSAVLSQLRRAYIVKHNQLGHEVFVRVVESNSKPRVFPLPSGGIASVTLPPRRVVWDPTTGREIKRLARKYLACRIGGVEDDDALECLVVNVATGHASILETSAPVGVLSCPLLEEANTKWRVISTRLRKKVALNSWPRLELQRHPLSSLQAGQASSGSSPGTLSLSYYFFVVDGDAGQQSLQEEVESNASGDEPGTIQVGYQETGPWVKIGSMYSQGAVPWVIGEEQVASETKVERGVKHLVVRSLVVVVNETDLPIAVCLCPRSLLCSDLVGQNDGNSGGARSSQWQTVVLEEVFENQRYQPVAGWGSSWPGHLFLTDPKRWSDRSFKQSSQEFLEPPLPAGWEWTSDWQVEKAGHVNREGWAYAPAFRISHWPPSAKARRRGVLDFTRRRRWVRTRERVAGAGGEDRMIVGVLQPGEDVPLPSACLRRSSADYCIQVRPYGGGDVTTAQHEWSVAVRVRAKKRSNERVPAWEFRARALSETCELVCCTLAEDDPKSLRQKSGGVDAGSLGNMQNRTNAAETCSVQQESVSSVHGGHAVGTTSEGILEGQSNAAGSRILDLGKEPVWLSMEASCKTLGLVGAQESAKDWRVTIRPPILIENLLPVAGTLRLWEKPMDSSNLIIRCEGNLGAGQQTGTCFADLRQTLYLSFVPEGGWTASQEHCMISHPYKEVAKSINYLNKRTGRRLKVAVEQKLGSHAGAAKVVCLSVPCWLDVVNCPPLAFRLVELQTDKRPQHSKDMTIGAGLRKTTSRQISRMKQSLKMPSLVEEVTEVEIVDQPTMLSKCNVETMGLIVGLRGEYESVFGPPTPIASFEDEQVEIQASAKGGWFMRLMVTLDVCPYATENVKVIKLRPYVVFTNRLGQPVHFRQSNVESYSKVFNQDDWRVWCLSVASEQAQIGQLKTNSSEWSQPFAMSEEGVTHLVLRGKGSRRVEPLRLDIHSGEGESQYVVAIRCGAQPPFRVENRSMKTIVEFRQSGSEMLPFQRLEPHSTAAFAWEIPLGEKILDIQVVGDQHVMGKYTIESVGEHFPLVVDNATEGSEFLGLSVDVVIEGAVKVVWIGDWKGTPDQAGGAGHAFAQNVYRDGRSNSLKSGLDANAEKEKGEKRLRNGNAQMHKELILDIYSLGLAIIDHRPQELLFLSMRSLLVTLSSSGTGLSRFKMSLGKVQLDNQLFNTSLPVILAPEHSSDGDEASALRAVVTVRDEAMEGTIVYEYIGIQVVDEPWRINLHEPIIWRLMELYQTLNLDRISGVGDEGAPVNVDPNVRIKPAWLGILVSVVVCSLLDISEVRFRLTLQTAAGTRPHNLLGVWGPLLTTLGNTHKMPIHFQSVVREHRYFRKSALMPAVMARMRRDLLHQPLRLLSGVDVLGMTSSALGTLSKGAAELSQDGRFLRLRSHQDRTVRIRNMGDGLLYGTEAAARALARGVTGLVTRPVAGAVEGGVPGLVRGTVKAAVSVVVQPISGILDFFALSVDGLDASCNRFTEAVNFEKTLDRMRLPRAIGGDKVLTLYDNNKATGQVILQLADAGAYFGRRDVFRDRGKFSDTDVYECHFDVPKQQIVMITSQRVMLLQRPHSHMKGERHMLVDPCAVIWDIQWIYLLATELASLKGSLQGPASEVILHVRYQKRYRHSIHCCPSSSEGDTEGQATKVRDAIEAAKVIFGPDRSALTTEFHNRRQSRPRPGSFGHPMGTSGRERTSGHVEGTQSALPADALTSPALPLSSLKWITRENVQNTTIFHCIWTSERELSACRACTLKLTGQEREIPIAIWRPAPEPGYVAVGDILQLGNNEPTIATTYRDDGSRKFAAPCGFQLVWRNADCGSIEPVSIWFPKAPVGYVALGCVAMQEYFEPDLTAVKCVHQSVVDKAELQHEPLWTSHHCKAPHYPVSLFEVRNEARTFLALHADVVSSSESSSPLGSVELKPLKVRVEGEVHASSAGHSDPQ
eukprot:SM000009S23509  [mRNA]  locus=s9:423530:451441:+ [translate_table: standard]